MKKRQSNVILLADDDKEEYLLTLEALAENNVSNELRWVGDGEELMDYLLHRGRYHEPQNSPSPGLILLNSNMPKKNGPEALKEIKSDPELRSIPVIVLTTAKTDEDIFQAYELGANSFIQKPESFKQFVHVIKIMVQYWFEIVKLPIQK